MSSIPTDKAAMDKAAAESVAPVDQWKSEDSGYEDMSMRRWLRKRIVTDLSPFDSNTTITTNNNKLQPTHYRYSPYLFKYTSAYGSFILLPLCCL
ncbi:hypothetical protein T06_4978 [Trichinella sp. T6]|nr:hypothetical protein T06_4978 [Trichinella sp. T6]